MNPAMFPQIAALLAKRDGANSSYAGTQMPTVVPKPRAYYGSIPEIAKAREADPRQVLANTLMANGASTAPVAGGGWAWADGIARALSGVGGALVNKSNDKKYASREAEFVRNLRVAANTAGTPPVAPPTAPVAPPVAPPAPPKPTPFEEAFAPFAEQPAQPPQMAPALPMMGAGLPAPIPRLPGVPSGPAASPTASPARAPGASRQQASTPSAPMNVRDLFMRGIVAQEGVQNKDGSWQTSFKGAVGPAQVMPGTAPLAAKLAGLPWDENKYRNDPQYNLALGEAYFAEQLREFGDPAKAAAAYNAGPGAVRRAMRRANRSGGDWTSYLPATTKNGKVIDTTEKYVQRFQRNLGSSVSQSVASGNTINEDVAGVPAVAVDAPNYEDVPELSQANYVPPEVETNRIRMAQQMLESGNPDMVALAQAYLDKGLDEQNAARVQRNSQQFTMGRDERSYEVDSRNRREDRNFGREETFSNQTFQSREGAANRAQQANIASADRAFQREERVASESFQAREARLDREARKAEFEATVTKNPYFNTAAGMKLRDELNNEITNNTSTISKYERMLDLLDGGLQTGSMYAGYGNEELIERFGGSNAALGEFAALSNETTLGKIGGSLGTAVSDGDRKFIISANVNPGKDEKTNRNLALATIGMLERKNDYTYARMEAEMAGPEALKSFNRNWRAFAESQAIVRYDRKGNVSSVTRSPMKFEEWLASRPTADANGNIVR